MGKKEQILIRKSRRNILKSEKKVNIDKKKTK